MTEKRFTVNFSAKNYAHFFDNGQEIDEFEVVRLLNRYSDLLEKKTKQTTLRGIDDD